MPPDMPTGRELFYTLYYVLTKVLFLYRHTRIPKMAAKINCKKRGKGWIWCGWEALFLLYQITWHVIWYNKNSWDGKRTRNYTTSRGIALEITNVHSHLHIRFCNFTHLFFASYLLSFYSVEDCSSNTESKVRAFFLLLFSHRTL